MLFCYSVIFDPIGAIIVIGVGVSFDVRSGYTYQRARSLGRLRRFAIGCGTVPLHAVVRGVAAALYSILPALDIRPSVFCVVFRVSLRRLLPTVRPSAIAQHLQLERRTTNATPVVDSQALDHVVYSGCRRYIVGVDAALFSSVWLK